MGVVVDVAESDVVDLFSPVSSGGFVSDDITLDKCWLVSGTLTTDLFDRVTAKI